MKTFVYFQNYSYLCSVKKRLTQETPKTLKRVGKNENLKPYESHDFIKGLESQNEILNLDLTPNGEGNLPNFRFFAAKINKTFQL